MIRVEIDSIRVSLMSQDRVVVLKDQETERYIPIWIGPFEAEAIRVELQGVSVQRPLTHDLLKTVFTELGGKVEHILISDLRNDVFYAQIKVNVNGRTVEIDARPSDSLALAVRLKCPIFVAEKVIERAGIEPENEVTGELDLGERSGSMPEVEDSDLGAFADFLNTLDLDDLDDN